LTVCNICFIAYYEKATRKVFRPLHTYFQNKKGVS
jgi:hypothetical protein